MTHSTNARRFYIDQGNQHTVVHCVPVHKAAWESTANDSPATHQVPAQGAAQPAFDQPTPNHLKSTQRRVSSLFRSARKRPSSSTS